MTSEHNSKTSILPPKQTTIILGWNVRTMYETGRYLMHVIQEMLKCNIGILGIIGCKWIGSGEKAHKTGSVVCYSGRGDVMVEYQYSLEEQSASHLWSCVL